MQTALYDPFMLFGGLLFGANVIGFPIKVQCAVHLCCFSKKLKDSLYFHYGKTDYHSLSLDTFHKARMEKDNELCNGMTYNPQF